jgi:hypothetical protein
MERQAKQSKASTQSVTLGSIPSLLHAACKQHVHMPSPGLTDLGGGRTCRQQAHVEATAHRHLRHGTQHAIGLLIFYYYSYVLDQVLNTSSCLLWISDACCQRMKRSRGLARCGAVRSSIAFTSIISFPYLSPDLQANPKARLLLPPWEIRKDTYKSDSIVS